jgi:hypothetical protein
VAVTAGVADECRRVVESVAAAEHRRVDGSEPLGVDAARHHLDASVCPDSLDEVTPGRLARGDDSVDTAEEPPLVAP